MTGGREPPKAFLAVATCNLATGALAVLAAFATAAPAPTKAGTVERIEVTSVTRDVAALWIRVRLPEGVPGERLTFTGTISAGNVPVPVKPPVQVVLQGSGPGPAAALVAADVDLARLPEGILALLGSRDFAVSLKGKLSGGKGEFPIQAVGRLRPAAPDLVAPASAVSTFAVFSGARLAGLSLKKAEGEATVAVFNPAGFDLLVEEIRYELYAGSRLLFSGTRRLVRLHARRANEVTLPLDVRHADLLAAAGTAVSSGGTIPARLAAKVTIKAGGGRVTIPVDQSGTVRLAP